MRTHVRLENSEDLEAPQFPETEDTWNLLTTEEVRKAVSKAGDTTPGPDAIIRRLAFKAVERGTIPQCHVQALGHRPDPEPSGRDRRLSAK